MAGNAKRRRSTRAVGETDGQKAARTTKKPTSTKKTKTIENSSWYHAFTKGDEEYNTYMAIEWGFEKHGDIPLFEKMSLEGAQSGLSWLTILRKREAYRRVFFGFNPTKVAKMTSKDIEDIVSFEHDDKRQVVVRHKGKIESVISNAKCLLKLREGSPGEANAFSHFMWSFVDNKPILNHHSSMSECPSKSPESEAMSAALKKLGFRFVGPTTCYALMQSVGMVIDHPINTPEWKAAKVRLSAREGGFQARK